MNKKEPIKISTNPGNKKIIFGEDGEVVDKPVQEKKESDKNNKNSKKNNNKLKNGTENDLGKKWHQQYDEHNSKELAEIKESEFRTFEEHCKKCFDEEVEKLVKSAKHF